jgi:hypothetical protein
MSVQSQLQNGVDVLALASVADRGRNLPTNPVTGANFG